MYLRKTFLFLTIVFTLSCEFSDPELYDLVLSIKAQNDELLAEAKSLKAQSDALIQELKVSAAKQTELLAKVNELQVQLSSVIVKINQLSTQLQTQGADITSIKSQLDDLQKKYEGILKQLEQLQQLSKILAEIEILKNTIAGLVSNSAIILNSLTENKNQLEAIKTQIAAIQVKLNENFTAISQLTAQLTQQGVNINQILLQIAELKKANEELKAMLEELLEDKSPVPTDGLVGYWPFNGNANDESGNNLNGVVVGAKLTSNRNQELNKAYEFQSGALNKIDIDLRSKYANGVSKEYSFMMWVKANRTVTTMEDRTGCNGTVSVPMANSNQNWAFNPFEAGTSKIGVGFSIGTNGVFVANHATNLLISRASVPGQYNDFHCIIVTEKDNVMKVYIDGVIKKTITNYCANSEKKIGEIVFLGGQLYSPNFSGIIDDFGVWNRPLTDDEILKLYKGEKF